MFTIQSNRVKRKVCQDPKNVKKIVVNFGLINLGQIFAVNLVCLDITFQVNMFKMLHFPRTFEIFFTFSLQFGAFHAPCFPGMTLLYLPCDMLKLMLIFLNPGLTFLNPGLTFSDQD